MINLGLSAGVHGEKGMSELWRLKETANVRVIEEIILNGPASMTAGFTA